MPTRIVPPTLPRPAARRAPAPPCRRGGAACPTVPSERPNIDGPRDELLPVELPADELVDQGVLERPCLRAAVLLDVPPGFPVHPVPSYPRGPASDAGLLVRRRSSPIGCVPGEGHGGAFCNWTSVPRSSESARPRSRMSTPIPPAFCRWNRVRETVSLSRVATEQITETSAGSRRTASDVRGRPRDARGARSARGASRSSGSPTSPASSASRRARSTGSGRARRARLGRAGHRGPVLARDPGAPPRLELGRPADREGIPNGRRRVPHAPRRDDRAGGARRQRVALPRARGDLAADPARHARRLEDAGLRVGERPGRARLVIRRRRSRRCSAGGCSSRRRGAG